MRFGYNLKNSCFYSIYFLLFLVLGQPQEGLAQFSSRVTNTNDSGSGSLRSAISFSNDILFGGDDINFDLPGTGPWVINLNSPLPPISRRYNISGFTQEGANFNTGNLVILSGPGSGRGIEVQQNNVTVEGLEIRNFDIGIFTVDGGNGTDIRQNVIYGNNRAIQVQTRDVDIDGNRIGTNASGTAVPQPNNTGILVFEDNASINNNVISGNTNRCIETNNADDISITVNRIGTDLSGFTSLGNNDIGIFMNGGSGAQIDNNVISGIRNIGILLDGVDDAFITDNQIGVGPDGTSVLSNDDGIVFQSNNVGTSSSVIISENTIAYNTSFGINFLGSGVANEVRITENRIFCNNGNGIRTQGANQGKTEPVIVNANTSFISGTAGNGDLVELYLNRSCGRDEGEVFLGIANNSGGTWQLNASSFATAVSVGDQITALAIDGLGNTSQFSSVQTVLAPFTVVNTNDSGPGSLRWVIDNANTVAGAQSVTFNLSSTGPWLISLQSSLPAITEDLTLDARSQAGWDWDQGRTLVLDGTNVNGSNIRGLDVQASNCWVSGFELINFDRGGTSESGIYLLNANNTLIEQNIISGNGLGIEVTGSATGSCTIRNNRLGTNVTGNTAFGNGTGILTTTLNVMTIENNLISGNNTGMILDGLRGSLIQSNLIGVAGDGTTPLPNNDGITFQSNFGSNSNNIISRNTIAYQTNRGLTLDGSTLGTDIFINSIFCNGGGGILLNGGNMNLSPPTVETATAFFIKGTAGAGDFVDIFVDRNCNRDQGEIYLGCVTASASGEWSLDDDLFVVPINEGDQITATRTVSNSTSSFSPPLTVINPFTVSNTNDDGPGSLRVALEASNASSAGQSPVFALSGNGPWEITLNSSLPPITNTIVLDARTISGWDWDQGNTLILNGANITDANTTALGLQIQADGTQVYGLELVNFSSNTFSAGIAISSDNVWVEQNVVRANEDGIQINSGNNATIRNNRCGTSANGTSAPNGNAVGIISFGGQGHLFENNICSNNSLAGILIDNVSNATIQNNTIGLDINRNVLPNFLGINLQDANGGPNSNITIQNNEIAYNQYALWYFSATSGNQIQISRNAIYCNSVTAFLFRGGNGNLSPPSFTNTTTAEVTGTGTNGHTIEIYADTLCNRDQGLAYLGNAVVSGGQWSLSDVAFNFALQAGYQVTAIAIDPAGNTSDFSSASLVQDPFVVTNTQDNGQGSLRWAMTNALNAGGATVSFQLPGQGPWQINLTSLLPFINSAVTVDATTQPGSSLDTAVVLNGGGNLALGFRISGIGGGVKGFEIQNFTTGIEMSSQNALVESNTINECTEAIVLTGASNNTILGNQLGSSRDGSLAEANQRGVRIEASNANIITDNLISGNLQEGVLIRGGASTNQISRNFIGTDRSGTNPMANAEGIVISGTTSGNTIGSDIEGDGNLISGNAGNGIRLGASASNNRILGNQIGVQATTTDAGQLTTLNPLANGGNGITLNGPNNQVGGDINLPGNVIAYNQLNGVEVSGITAIQNNIRNNRIFCNSQEGIRLQAGGNQSISRPLITQLNPFSIDGTSSPLTLVDVYANDLCPDGQGEIYLGTVQATSTGTWVLETTVVDRVYTASATDSLGNTSQFSDTVSLGPPFTPTNLIARAVSNLQIELNWLDQSPNELGYEVWRSEANANNFQLLQGNLAPETNTYLDDVSTNVRYFYQVRAFNDRGNSAFSNISSDSTSLSVIKAPNNLTLSLDQSNPSNLVNISWSDNSTREIGFSIERGSLFTEGEFIEIAQVDSNITTYQDTVLANLGYTYRVRALGNERNSTFSETAQIITPENLQISLPPPPFDLDAESVSEQQINLNWSYGTSPLTYFKIERSLTNVPADFQVIDTVLNNILSENKLYIDSLNLEKGQTYYYRVLACAQRNSLPSDVDSAQAICNLQVIVQVNDANSNEVSICNGKSATLSVSSEIIGARYQWLKNDPSVPGLVYVPISGATDQTFFADREGSYRCEVSVGLGSTCNRQSINDVVVIVQEQNDSVSVSFLDGELVSSLDDADAYQWYFNFDPIDNATSSRYSPTQNGTYFLVVQEGTCSFTSNLLVVNITGLEERNLSSLMKLSPNPAGSKTEFRVEASFRGAYQLQLLDVRGQVFQQWEGIKSTQLLSQELDLDALPSGFYLLELKTEFGQGLIRLIRQ